MFGRKPAEPRHIPQRSGTRLDPQFYQSIADRLEANGGAKTSATDVAVSVGNAIFNVVSSYLDRLSDSRGLREFAGLFDGRGQSVVAADGMIDWIADRQSGNVPEFIHTLLARLDDVLSRPA